MKTLRNVKNLFSIMLIVLAAYSCNNDNDDSTFVPGSEVYQLMEVGITGISGTAVFTENEDGLMLKYTYILTLNRFLFLYGKQFFYAVIYRIAQQHYF